MFRFTFLALGIAGSIVPDVRAQLSLQQVGTGFNQPLFLTAAPGSGKPNQVYVVEKGGLIRTLNTGNGAIGATPFLDLPAVLGAGQLLTSCLLYTSPSPRDS